jgi:hypothetical protein
MVVACLNDWPKIHMNLSNNMWMTSVVSELKTTVESILLINSGMWRQKRLAAATPAA